MNPEETLREDHRPTDPVQVLSSIKDQAIILAMAGKYVCEARVLKRMGDAIERDVERLKGLIDDLRGQFVGKPPEGIDFDPYLQGLYGIAERLKSPEAPAQGQVNLEDLSRDLGEKIRSLRAALDSFKQKVYGEPISYTTTDYALTQWGRIRPAVGSVAKAGSRLIKVAAAGVLCIVVVFLVLFWTMEKEEVFVKEMEAAKEQVQSRQKDLGRIEAELAEIRRQLAMVRTDELTREEKVHVLDLNVKAHKLREERDRVQMETRQYQKTLDEALRKLRELQDKSLLQRLLRQ